MENAKAIAGQRMPSSQAFDPLKQPIFAKFVRRTQLNHIVERLLEFYKTDISKLDSVKSAERSLKDDNIDQASITLQVASDDEKLIFDFDLEDSKRKQLKEIFNEAVKVGQMKLDEIQAKSANFQSQSDY